MDTPLRNPQFEFPINGSRVPAHIEARQIIARGIEPELRLLHRLDWRKRCAEIVFFVFLCLAGMLINLKSREAVSGAFVPVLQMLATLGTALGFNAFLLLMDDGMNGTLFSNQSLNRWVSVLLGLTCFVSFTAYRVLHIRHHHFLGDRNDPDDYENYSTNQVLVWTMHYVRLILGPYIYIFMIPSFAFQHGDALEKRQIVQEYVLLIVVYVLLFLMVPAGVLLSVWVLPLIITGYLTAVRGLAQHGLTDPKDPFLASRSMQVNRIMTFLMLNENYHLERHFFPEIPSYNLAKAHELIWPRVPRAVSGSSYLGFLLRFFVATLKADKTPIGLVDFSGKSP